VEKDVVDDTIWVEDFLKVGIDVGPIFQELLQVGVVLDDNVVHVAILIQHNLTFDQ
jgi:hypothetical protein